MSRRRTIIPVVVAFAILACFWAFGAGKRAQRSADAARRELLAKGFKLEPSEFDLTVPAELRMRGAELTAAAQYFQYGVGPRAREMVRQVGTNAMAVIWQQEHLPSSLGEDLWIPLREEITPNKVWLAQADRAVMGGDFGFEPTVNAGGDLMVPFLSDVRAMSLAWFADISLSLHDGRPAEAMTNLLALTRMTSAWKPGPAEVCHFVRFACAATAQNALWQVLQRRGWSDNELSTVQHEWEAADFFCGLPETAALARASSVAACRREREQPASTGPSLGQVIAEFFSTPSGAWTSVRIWLQNSRYRSTGTFEDEVAMMRFYRDRELELRRAVTLDTWDKMRSMPGATNSAPMDSRSGARFRGLLGARQAGMLFARQGRTLLARAAETEARRRLCVVALALERYHGQTGRYPETLAQLMPQFLNSVPNDFIDGKPLRYHRADGDEFVLYSLGLDCIDQGGTSMPSEFRNRISPGPSRPLEGDLIWPRAATPAEVEQANAAENNARMRLASAARYGPPQK